MLCVGARGVRPGGVGAKAGHDASELEALQLEAELEAELVHNHV